MYAATISGTSEINGSPSRISFLTAEEEWVQIGFSSLRWG